MNMVTFKSRFILQLPVAPLSDNGHQAEASDDASNNWYLGGGDGVLKFIRSIFHRQVRNILSVELNRSISPLYTYVVK